MVAEFFSLPTLGFLAFVAWCRVLLPDLGSSIDHPLNLGQTLDIGLGVVSKAVWKEEMKHNVAIVTISNTMTWTGHLVFINMNMNLASGFHPTTQ